MLRGNRVIEITVVRKVALAYLHTRLKFTSRRVSIHFLCVNQLPKYKVMVILSFYSFFSTYCVWLLSWFFEFTDQNWSKWFWAYMSCTSSLLNIHRMKLSQSLFGAGGKCTYCFGKLNAFCYYGLNSMRAQRS